MTPATLTIRIPGEPVAQGRAKFRVWKATDGRSGVTAYDPAKSRDWKATARQHMEDAAAGEWLPLSGPLELRVLAIFTCPKTDHRKKDLRPRRWHAKKPDGDNVLKAIKDAAKGVLWLDDSQVARASIEKVIGAQGEAPFLQIQVRELSEGGGWQEEERRPLALTASEIAQGRAALGEDRFELERLAREQERAKL